MKERYLLEDGSDNGFSLITDYDGNDEQAFDVNVKSGEILPVLPLRNMVLFPGVFLPITVGRKSSLKLVRDADKKHKDIAVVCQRSAHTEDPKLEDLHNIGTVGRIVRILEMPDQTTTVILQGMKRLSLTSIIETHPYLKGEIELLEEDVPGKDDKEFQALVETCKDLTMRYIKSSDVMHQDSSFAIKNINNSMFLVNFICSNLPFKKDEKMDLLSINSLRERTYHLLEILNREVQLAEIKASIQMRAREDIDQQQREYLLNQQIKTIQDELGGNPVEQEIADLKEKAKEKKWNEDTAAHFEKEVNKRHRHSNHRPASPADFPVFPHPERKNLPRNQPRRHIPSCSRNRHSRPFPAG
jgi:ATP-dependent Lon protease